MAEAETDPVIAYLKKNGLYDTFKVAAGVAKDATVGDVHQTTALGNEDDPKKKPPAKVPVAQNAPPKPATPALDGDAPAGGNASLAKRYREADDAPFFKGQANLYVNRPLTPASAQRLHDWAVVQGIPNVVPADLMHATQVHSTAEVDTDKFKPLSTLIDVGATRWLSQLGKGNALVMFFDSPDMQQRFAEAVAAGASWDFPMFMTHITLSYDTGDIDAHMYGVGKAPDFPLQLGPEVFADSNDNWTSDNGLVAKAGDGFDFTMSVTKADADKQMIFGWLSITHVNGELIVDKQDDAIQLSDNPADGSTGLESAAYDFVLHSREHGTMHAMRDTGKMVESIVFTPEKAAAGLVAKNEKGETIYGWWGGFLVQNAEVWKAYKNNELPEFSIGGHAKHVEIAPVAAQ